MLLQHQYHTPLGSCPSGSVCLAVLMGLGCIYFMCMSLSPAGMTVYYVHAWRLWEQDEGQAYPLQAASVLTAEQCLHPKSSTVEVHPGLSLGVSLLLDLLPPYFCCSWGSRTPPHGKLLLSRTLREFRTPKVSTTARQSKKPTMSETAQVNPGRQPVLTLT